MCDLGPHLFPRTNPWPWRSVMNARSPTQTLKTLAEHYDCVVILHYWRRKSLSVALFYVGTVSLSAIKQIHWVTASRLHVTAAQWANTQTRLLVERTADRQHWHLTAALPRDDDAASSLNLVLHSGLTLNWCLPLSQWWLLFWGGCFFFMLFIVGRIYSGLMRKKCLNLTALQCNDGQQLVYFFYFVGTFQRFAGVFAYFLVKVN